jgi:antitoxin component YwqK of YwqJK toxin-antitoxin module
MKLHFLLCPVFCLVLPGCGPSQPKEAEERASIELETRSDGLAYGKKSPTPFSGEAVTFYQGTNRQSVETYQEGKPHGTWRRYWSNGQIKREQQWVHGSQIHQRQWYEDGVLKEDLNMKDGKGNGRIRMWWPDGRLRRTAFVGDDLRPHGHALEYAEDGSVVVDAIFQHGQYVSGRLKQDTLASRAAAEAD